MKNYFVIVFIASLMSLNTMAQTPCINGMAGDYPCRFMDLLSHMSLSDLGVNVNNPNTNDIFGWVSPNTGKEYALVGCRNGTAFVDVSNPVNPIYLGMLPTHSINSLWRDIETYGHYCLAVSEASDHGLQIFDLLQLDTVSSPPLVFTETAHYAGFSNCHTVAVDTANGYAYCNGTNTFSGGLHIVDINDPLNPVLAGGFSEGGYTHDCFVWHYDGADPDHAGDEIVFACNGGSLVMVDATNKADVQSLGTYYYDNNASVGYIHQGWVTKDKRFFMLNDELDEMNFGNMTRSYIFDISDLDNLIYNGYYQSTNTSIDHNLYMHDQFTYESNYCSGVRVLDNIRMDETIVNEVAFFDLYPAHDNPVFEGTWSNYPYLPSGIILATSMYDGIYIIRPNFLTLSENEFEYTCADSMLQFNIEVNANLFFPLTLSLSGMGNVTITNLTITAPGVYPVALNQISGLGNGVHAGKIALVSTNGQSYDLPISINVSGVASTPTIAADGVQQNQMVSVMDLPAAVFSWQADEPLPSYTFQISTDANFANIQYSQTINGLSTSGINLSVGNFFWRVGTPGGCWSDAYGFIVDSANEIGESIHTGLSIFPNPGEDIIHLQSSSSIGEMVIIDSQGKVWVRTNILDSKTQIDTTNLPQGLYFIRANKAVRYWIKM
jgi:choice-of-anchor B domain-containing protein